MFCPECGTKNEDGALFCAECGIKLENNDFAAARSADTSYITNQTAAVVPRKPMTKASKVLVVELVLLCIAVFAFYKIGNSHYDAKAVAKSHAISQMNGDWESVYEDFDIKEDDFINKDAFIKAYEDTELVKYSNLKVSGGTKSSTEDDEIVSYVTVKYAISGDDEESEDVLSMVKQAEKKLLLFDDWKVSPSGYICKDFTIYVPTGAEVSLDGKKIDSSYLSSDDSDEYGDCYIIPRIFYGNYEISVTKANMEDVTEHIDTSDGYYQLSSMQIKSDLLENAVTQAGEDWNSILSALVAQKDYKEVKDLFVSDDAFEENYNSSLESFTEDEVKSVTIGSMTPYVSYTQADGGIYITVELSYDYDISFMKEDWWDGTKSQESYSSSSYTDIQYFLSDDEMKIYDMYCSIYYY